MKIKKVLLMSMMMAFMPFSSIHVNAAPLPVNLQAGYNDPTTSQGGPQRGPVLVPEVSIEDYTLSFDTSCYGCTLTLLDEDGEVAYTTIITSDTLVLPSTLSGEYCNFDFVIYDSTLYSTYGCCAIYLESQTANRNYATNNISRCYFERICYDPDTNPPSWATNTAAVICKDTSITIDNNFFTSTPRYFIIDSCSSISIGDNGIGINYSEASTYPRQHDTLVYVIPSSVNKSIRQSILYSNSIPISTDSGCSFITKLACCKSHITYNSIFARIWII